MGSYILRRLLLLPITVFFILLINFVIINLAPGDPTSVTQVSAEGGASRKAEQTTAFGGDMRYLQFREHYGLTLPILFNDWPFLSKQDVYHSLERLAEKKDEMSVKSYDALRVRLGDQAKYIMPALLEMMQTSSGIIQELASKFFIRGGTRQAIVKAYLNDDEKAFNQTSAESNLFLLAHAIRQDDSKEERIANVKALREWYNKHRATYRLDPTFNEKIGIFFFETRIFRYMSRVLTLDFGTMRNDSNKSVIEEVVKRFKYSLTLSIIPMLLTLVLCQIFGFWMAYRHYQWQDLSLNLIFLILYAIPIFVVAPFLIEKIALNNTFPFTSIPIPISGFTSREAIYENLNSWQRLMNTMQHLFLPLVAIMYGGLAAQTRLSRTAVLEVLKQDYVRTAKAKGLSSFEILRKHVARNAGITIVTSVAASFGAVLGGSLIVETLFDIDGFGKFFYDAILNRDYNVIMFSALAGSILSLIGYLVADLLYMILDPRVRLE